MPETGIGLFPDVGGMHFLSRLEGGLGVYLALSGVRLEGNDALYAGLATHYIPSKRIEEFRRALYGSDLCADGTEVTKLLDAYHDPSVDPLKSSLAKNREDIDRIFCNKRTVGEIVSLLEQTASSLGGGSEFARATLDSIRAKSPTSLVVTLEGLRRGSQLDLGDDLRMEFRMGQSFMREGSDFYEGIRSVLVDKDHSPKWRPASIEEVCDNEVLSYFAEPSDGDLDLSITKRKFSAKL